MSRMQRGGPAICAIAVLFLFVSYAGVDAADWKEEKGQRFIVYTNGGNTSGSTILKNAEKLLDKILEDLDIDKPNGFWQWDRRVKIYVYSNRWEYLKDDYPPKWTSSLVKFGGKGKTKVITMYDMGRRLATSVLPHQITHMIMCEIEQGALATRGKPDFWLQEGIAQHQEEDWWGTERSANKLLHKHIEDKDVFTLKSMRVAPYQNNRQFVLYRYSPDENAFKEEASLLGAGEKDAKKPKDPLASEKETMAKERESLRLYLAKTVSLTNFMIRKYGKQRFAEFLEKIRKGTELEAALKTLCGKKTTIQDLEKVWLDHVKEAKKRDFTPG